MTRGVGGRMSGIRSDAMARNAAVCAPRAQVFAGGVPFVRGWSSARRAAVDLAAQLVRAGLSEDFGGLRADVSAYGDGLVCLGPVGADVAETLAVLLARGLCAELEIEQSRADESSAA